MTIRVNNLARTNSVFKTNAGGSRREVKDRIRSRFEFRTIKSSRDNDLSAHQLCWTSERVRDVNTVITGFLLNGTQTLKIRRTDFRKNFSSLILD